MFGIVCQRVGGDGRERTESVQQKSEADGQDFWTRLAQVIQDTLAEAAQRNWRSGAAHGWHLVSTTFYPVVAKVSVSGNGVDYGPNQWRTAQGHELLVDVPKTKGF